MEGLLVDSCTSAAMTAATLAKAAVAEKAAAVSQQRQQLKSMTLTKQT